MSIAARIKGLGFDLSRMVVVGSAVLEVLGIREANDIDMVAHADVLARLEADSSWRKRVRKDGSYIFIKAGFEIGNNWFKPGPENDFGDLLKMGTFTTDDVRFVNPETVLAWKKRRNRSKDQGDIKLLEQYLKNPSS